MRRILSLSLTKRLKSNVVQTRTFQTVKTEIPPLVNGSWLQKQLERRQSPNQNNSNNNNNNNNIIKIIDGSWYLPTAKRNPIQEFSQIRIPGAIYFDLEEIRDKNSPYPRMMPSSDQFQNHMNRLGLTNDDHIIVYDGAGIFSSPRVWYMLKAMGVKNVSILDGGLALWRKEKRPIEEGPVSNKSSTKSTFTARFNQSSIADIERIKRIVAGQDNALIVDARAPDRFSGKVKEANSKLRSGHIPGSVSLHYQLLLDDTGLCYRPVKELKTIFNTFGVDVHKQPVVTTCGSGVTAAIVSFGIHLVQWTDQKDSSKYPSLSLYNGSWNEWGSRTDCPVETDDK